MTTPQLTDDELRDLAHSAYEEAMSFGLSVDTFLRYFKGIRNRLAQPAAAGQGEAATQDKLDSLLEAAQYLSHRRRVAAAPPAPGGDVLRHLADWFAHRRYGLYDGEFVAQEIRRAIAEDSAYLQSTQGQDAAPAEQAQTLPSDQIIDLAGALEVRCSRSQRTSMTDFNKLADALESNTSRGTGAEAMSKQSAAAYCTGLALIFAGTGANSAAIVTGLVVVTLGLFEVADAIRGKP